MSQPQHMLALEKANEIRFARARVKRDLYARRITLREALDHPAVEGMRVFDLLCSQWRYGPPKTRRALALAAAFTGSIRPIPEHKTVGSLTDRQKRALLQACGCESERKDVAA